MNPNTASRGISLRPTTVSKPMTRVRAPMRIRRDQPPVPMATVTSAAHATTPAGFETEKMAAAEDRLRARQMRRVLNRPGLTGWLNFKDRLWLIAQRPRQVSAPVLDRAAIARLARRLESGVAGGIPSATLASSLWMRTIRLGVGEALLDAFAPLSDAELCTVTVIYRGWSYTPAELEGVTAARIKGQFRQHLFRAGVLGVPGPLFAFMHGEFEPSTGRYQIHFHIVTTAAKAAALKAGLTSKTIKGYTATATGASPVWCSPVRDRVRQLSYLVKAYWPSRPVVIIDGKPKRRRDPCRIPEPFHTQVLLWFDRQRFSDMVVMNDCWSRRNGGTAAMRRLYLFVTGAA
ncbi:hypothetical protein [Methylobacterium thuringiense]|uniref:Uncharacterized protein n=1 Tax=Methylobacterium thuringiense TaxID=1003091 RepID=A0ABQ4TIB7_9HYPH|nr:hypothetical protein [Methylobacterium thuringiense]GJE53797.1 hypothetical protein EKPJFOCH_0265 [Methylobacterium thuringiense]